MDRLKGKTALIFGAGPNIGGTIAHFMAREGAKITVMDVAEAQASHAEAFLRGRGFECMGLAGDGTREPDIRRAFEETRKRFGQLDIMVNLVAVAGGKTVADITLEEWDFQIKGSLTSGMLTSKLAVDAMSRDSRKGSLIHILSTGAHYGHPGHPAYTAAKAGLLNLSRAVAMEAAHLGIRCNTITPIGMEHNLWTVRKSSMSDPRSRIGTSISDALILDRSFAPDRNDPATRYNYSIEDVLQNVPLARLPRASDVAWAAVFLASEESGFMTGVDFPVDGGVRARYPIWRPGDYSGITLETYLENIDITEYGEPVARFQYP